MYHTLLLMLLVGATLSKHPEEDQKLKSIRDRSHHVARSCAEIKSKYSENEDGLYYLTTENGVVYQTFCDMTSSESAWTLVASVHENNIHGKCTLGDRWTSEQGNNPFRPEGDGNWVNMNTFGQVEGSTSDDYKNPGYYDLKAKDMSVWHVPNNQRVNDWKQTAILRYHTETQFLTQHGGNLYELFKSYPVKWMAGAPLRDNGPSIPIVYDYGSRETTKAFYGPYAQREMEPGFITFRAINYEWASTAICSGTKPKGGQVDAYCIGGGGFFPEGAPQQCGDFVSFAWSGYGTHQGWSVSKDMLESAVLLFYR
ncbi:intelectin [Esox lucius]|uniref:Fibrinogen C-terminal domain-containing protein n=1 Tax=Esox lucius TaxID=8010 RepID=A0AAY5KU44_ESOLU|nr:intelectin [Esox lucius]